MGNSGASFAAELKRLHKASGKKYEDYKDHRGNELPKATLSALFNGKFTEAPPWDRIQIIVKTCGGDEEWWRRRHGELEADLERTPRATTAKREAPPTIGQWDPARLGVHQAITVEGARSDELTPYLLRPHDEEVRGALRNGHRLVVLTGSPCTGKTRAALEAVRSELPHLPVVRPVTAGELVRRAGELTEPVVLWLNEMHRHLTEEAVEVLAAAPDFVRIVGTTTSSEWDKLADEHGQHAAARELLIEAFRVQVPEVFSKAELKQVGNRDARLTFAARAAEDGRLIQALTGGPELMRLYRNPDHALFAAIIDAALDGARLSGKSFVPLPFLTAAAPGYLTAAQRAGCRFEDGLALATRPVRGVLALTSRREAQDLGPADHVEPHEFLVQQISRERQAVPGATWQALLDHVHEPPARLAVARAAVRYGYRRIAMSALLPIATDADVVKMVWSQVLGAHWRRSHPDWEAWLREGARLGDAEAMWFLARLAAERGDRQELVWWWRRLLEADNGRGMQDQVGELEQHGLVDEAIEWLRPRAQAGNSDAVNAMSLLLWNAERYDEAIELMLPLAAAGDHGAAWRLAHLYAKCGNEQEAQKWRAKSEPVTPRHQEQKASELSEARLRALLDDGAIGARARLSTLLRRTDRAEEALELWVARAEAGEHVPILHYTEILEQLGRSDEAIAWLEERATNRTCMMKLGMMLRDRGDLDAADVWDRRAALAGHGPIARRLAEVHRQAGEIRQAVELLRPSADHDAQSEAALVALLPEIGRAAEAEARMRNRLERGGLWGSTTELAAFLRRQGRADEADDLETYGVEPGGATATPWRSEPPG